MPVIPIDGEHKWRDLARVFAVMTSPYDDALCDERALVQAWNIKLSRDDEAGEFNVQKRELAAILAAPRLSDVVSAMEQDSDAGQIAGELLLLTLQLDAQDRNASLRKARYLITSRNDMINITATKKLLASDTSIKNAWYRFRAVAHLWAAIVILAPDRSNDQLTFGRPLPIRQIFELISNSPMGEIASISKWLFSRADQVIPRHQSKKGQAILEASNVWLFPDSLVSASLDFELPALPDWTSRVLDTYRRDYQ